MHKERFDWKGGKIVLWELNALVADAPLETQHEALQEDLAHVEFGGAVVLDVTFQSDVFVVQVVKNQHWEEPVLRVECSDVLSLERALASAIDAAARARGPR